MDRFIALTASGIALGSVYGLVALGFLVAYKTTGIINFAQGAMVTVGAYLGVWAIATAGLSQISTYVFVIGVMFVCGVILQQIVHAPLRGQSVIVVVLATLAAGMIMTALLKIWQGALPQSLASPVGTSVVRVGGAAIPVHNLIVVAITGVTMAIMGATYRWTQLGRQMRALAADPETAMLYGIRARGLAMFGFGVSGAFAGLAGLLIAPMSSVSLNLGFPAMISAFAAAVIGGFGRLDGVVVGALLIGLVYQYGGGYIAYQFQEIYPFLLMIGVIALAPRGILSGGAGERV